MTTLSAQTMRERAARLADEVLFPAALEVDRADRVPASHLDLLAEQGFYGIAAPPDAGGLGADGTAPSHAQVRGGANSVADLVQTLASGCLATTFVWIQHRSCVVAAASSQQPGIRERWLAPLARGELRAGIAYAGARGGPSQARVRRIDDSLVLDGDVPWVSGWGMIDVIHVAAVDEHDIIHFLLVDAVPSATLSVTPLELIAAQASGTVTVRLRGHQVPADRLTATKPYGEWAQSEASGSAVNGFLALGIVDRCRRLRGVPGWLDDELAECRAQLLSGDPAHIVSGRAAGAELAWRASATLAVHVGSRSVLPTEHAQRLLREAAFLLVFGSRPAIRDALLARLAP